MRSQFLSGAAPSAAALALALALLGTSRLAAAADPVLVQGSGITVTTQDLLSESRRIPPEAREKILADPDDATRLATNFYVRRALAAQAVAAGLENDPTVQAQLRAAHDRVLSEARLAQIDEKNKPDDATLDQYARTTYQAEPKRFAAPEEIRVRHILIGGTDTAARAKAEKLLAELKGGADFEALAKANSDDKASAAKGGELDFFGPGRMVKPFDEAAFALKTPGELSPVVETQFGFHIIKLVERRPAGQRPYEEVREALRAEARDKIRNQARSAEAQRLLENATIDRDAIRALSAHEQQASK